MDTGRVYALSAAQHHDSLAARVNEQRRDSKNIQTVLISFSAGQYLGGAVRRISIPRRHLSLI